MIRKMILPFFLLISAGGSAQEIKNLARLQPADQSGNIRLEQLHTDSLSTSYVIWISESVRAHRHLHHSESIYVLEGTGNMRLGDKTVPIGPGDFFNIPENTVHALEVTSSGPVKVISFQAPKFDGKDRVFED